MLDVPGVLVPQHFPDTWPQREQGQVKGCWSLPGTWDAACNCCVPAAGAEQRRPC